MKYILAHCAAYMFAVVFCMQTLAAENVEFQRDVLPILKRHCLDCHGADEAESKLRLDSINGALKGGDSGEKAIVPGHSEQSYLIELITNKDPGKRMPPDSDALPDTEINILKAWIDNAAEWKTAEQEIAQPASSHWSFQPLKKPELPTGSAAISQQQPIDAFVSTRLQAAGLQMSEHAERRRLIRRLYLVMLGLPPTPEQVDSFMQDGHPNAWERLVDDVLNNPRYGERWAQHWLDLVRFGETNGYETNRERPNAWPYRDWVIDAFNSDKPYNKFIIEQIAGDAVGAYIGTSFLVAGPVDIVKGSNPELQQMQRQDELADIINTTSTAFMGLTVGCARCHNHKFDPIAQTDYYSMQAVFSGVNHGETGLPLSEETQAKVAALDAEIATLRNGLSKFSDKRSLREAVNARQNVDAFDAVSARFVRFTINATSGGQACIDELQVFSGEQNLALAGSGAKPSSSGNFVHPLHKLEHINDGIFGNPQSWISSTVSGGWVQIELPSKVMIESVVWGRDRTGSYGDRLVTDYRIDVSLDGKNWSSVSDSTDREAFLSNNATGPKYDFAAFANAEADSGRAMLEQLMQTVKRRDAMAQPRMIYAGRFSQPGATHRLYRGEPGAPREQVSPAAIASLDGVQLPNDAPEQQRRLEVAKWIASEENPLTARVLVNRLWQFHFGTGIVDTPSDFGGNGTKPSHPQLLDWLATEFIESGWSIRHMHRLILLSDTWQQDSRPVKAGLQTDAASRLLWRFPPRRLEAEGIRDCILAATGNLNPAMGGPGFSAFEVELENVRHYFPKKSYGPGDWRRMVYQTKVRQERDSVFGVFDCPDGSQVTPQRSRSTTPLQALNLMNSRFLVQQADLFAERLNAEGGSEEEKIARSYTLCFGRNAEPDEVAVAAEFIKTTGWTQFARAMLNANEFVFIP